MGGVRIGVNLFLRLIDFCTAQLQAQGHSRSCVESNKEEEVEARVSETSLQARVGVLGARVQTPPLNHHTSYPSSSSVEVRVPHARPFMGVFEKSIFKRCGQLS